MTDSKQAASVEQLLSEIRSFTIALLGDSLVGIYVHGSCAFGCFHFSQSDIDYLVIVDRPLTLAEKTAYISKILDLVPQCPAKEIEMSVVLEKYCKQFVYPTPYDLHFSNTYLERAKANITAYCEQMQGEDPDLAAHFTVTRAVGIPLFGKPIGDVFASVPPAAYLDSIWLDIENAPADILQNPIYNILNLCRVLAYCKEERVLSKVQGGEWGLEHLPKKFHYMIRDALRGYNGDGKFSVFGEEACLQEFASELLERIKDEINFIQTLNCEN